MASARTRGIIFVAVALLAVLWTQCRTETVGESKASQKRERRTQEPRGKLRVGTATAETGAKSTVAPAAVAGRSEEMSAQRSVESRRIEATRFNDGLVVFRLDGGVSEFTDATRNDVFGVLPERFSQRETVRELSGSVVDEEGAPVSGAAVVGSSMPALLPGPVSGGAEFGGRAAATTDAGGRFTMRVPDTGLTVLAVSTEHGWSAPVAVPSGVTDVSAVELVLQGVASLSGAVTVAGAAGQGTVSVLRLDDATKVLARARIDDEGRYVLRLPPGTYAVRAQESIGAGWSEGETGRRRTVELRLRAGDELKHDFDFEAGRRVEVRSQAGGARVGYYLLERAVESYPTLREAISDPLETVLTASPTPDDEDGFAVFEGIEHDAFTVCATASSLDGGEERATCKRLDVESGQDTYAVVFEAM